MKKLLILTLFLFSHYSFSQNEIDHAIQARDMNPIKYGMNYGELVGEIKNNFFSSNLIKYSVDFRLDNQHKVNYIYKFSFLDISNKEFTDIRIVYMTEKDINNIYNFIIRQFVKSKKEGSWTSFSTTDLQSGELTTNYGLAVIFRFDNNGLFKVCFKQGMDNDTRSNMYSLDEINKLFGIN